MPRTLTGYTLAIFYLMAPLERIVGWLPLMVRAGISVDKIERLGLMLDKEPAESMAVTPIPAWEQIELAGVTHAYHREGHERGFLLGPIDLTLQPGEIVFVVGGNGSGKTTLAKLLTGLYVPEAGEIRLDGRPIVAENRESYRQLFTRGLRRRGRLRGPLGAGQSGPGRAGGPLPARVAVGPRGAGPGRRVLDDGPVARAAQASGPADRVPGGPLGLPL